MTSDGDDFGGDGGCEEEGDHDLASHTMEDGCTLNMMVECLQKIATGDFPTITCGNLRSRPTLGLTSAKSSGSHGEQGSISFNMEFSKLAHTVIDAGDKQDLDGGDYHAVSAQSIEAACNEYLAIGHPAVDRSQPPSTDAGQLVAEYVSNTGYVASKNRIAEMAEDRARDLVNTDLVNNDLVKIDLVNKDAVNVEILEQDFVNDDLVNKNSINVDVDGEKDNDKDVDAVNSNDTIGFGQQRTYETNSTHTGLFIGNIPLQSCPIPGADDKIADGFNNSSCKTLSYIPPTIQNGKIVIRPMIESIQNGASRWKTTAVSYFLEKRPYFYHVQEYAMSVWPGLRDVKATTNGFYFFQFKTVAYMEEAIEGGPWLFQRQPIVLQQWEQGMMLRKLKHTQVPAWIKLRHLPLELWMEEGLSTVSKACTRLDFARVCVMLDVSSKLPRHIIIMMPNEEGGEIPCKIDVEYEWLPPKCTSCMTLGHTAKVCVFTKPSNPAKPPVSLYVSKTVPTREGREHPRGESHIPKMGPARPPPMHDQERIPPTQGVDNQQEGREHDQERMPPTQGVDNRREGRELPRERRLSCEEKGKAIDVYNTFDALQLLDDAEDTSRGHIPRSETGIQTLHHVLTSFGRRSISDD
ncbi:UNVERIFIED_CONTAM: hypothetical protein Sindi_1457200 [Sesamum indicum]